MQAVARHILVAVVAGVLASSASGQEAFERHDGDTQFRGAAIHAPSGTVFLAAYNRNEVWQANPATGERLAAIPVGKGPAALALSLDESVLACVNYLDGTLSLVRLADHSVYATVPCGKGACAAAALADGWFAVANSFADTVTLVNAAKPGETRTLEVPGVPKAVAASGSTLAVATRAPAAVHFFKDNAQTPSAAVPIADAPLAIAAFGDAQFAVATKAGIIVADAARGTAVMRHEGAAVGVARDGDCLLVAGEAAVELLDAAWTPQSSIALPSAISALDARGGFIVAVSPQSAAWYSRGTIAAPTRQASAPAPQPPAPQPAAPPPAAPAPTVVEAQPVQEAPPAQTAAVEVEPKRQPEPAPPAEKPAQEKTSAKNDRVPKTMYRRVPMGGAETRAPQPGKRRPSTVPIAEPSRKSFFSAFAQPGDMTAPAGGFQPPDWTQPLRDIEGDEITGSFDSDEFNAKGHVRLKLDTLDFMADEFMYNQVSGEMRANNNIRISQDQSFAEADNIAYRVPAASELPEPTLLQANLGEQEQAKRRLTLGHVDIANLYADEPARQLTAKRLEYDFAKQTGVIENAKGHAGPWYFSAEKMTVLGPGSVDAENVWISTCDHDPPHYKLRLKNMAIRDGQFAMGNQMRVQLGGATTPLYWPHWRLRGGASDFDFDSGRRAKLGYYVNMGQQFPITPDVSLGLRLFPTTKEGVGFGLETKYDFMEKPASRLFRSQGSAHVLYTTEDRGYYDFFHRHEITDDLLLLAQAEQWFDRDFYKDFFYQQYRNRTEPRTFANMTLTKPAYIATATVRKDTHGFIHETERLPEASFHLLERRLTDRLYFSFDTLDGYYERGPSKLHAARSSSTGRLTLDLDWGEALSITPFTELETTAYSDLARSDDSGYRLSTTTGLTLQSRFHKTYPGASGFSGFKHIIVPSVTYSYRPEPTLDVEETPRFDALDNVYGRSRIESKIDNVVFGRDAETGEIWQVGRLTLYQGNDFWNENRKSDDYEIECDIRPRPWWGWQMAGERHIIDNEYDLNEPYFLEREALEFYEWFTGRPWNPEDAYQYDARYGDYSRFLSYLYYDDTNIGGNLNGRLGFAYAQTQSRKFNREVLYGLGYRLGENWGLAFEHRFDLERNQLARQRYELRRRLHCWDMTLRATGRESGWDIGVEFSIVAFPGTRVKF